MRVYIFGILISWSIGFLYSMEVNSRLSINVDEIPEKQLYDPRLIAVTSDGAYLAIRPNLSSKRNFHITDITTEPYEIKTINTDFQITHIKSKGTNTFFVGMENGTVQEYKYTSGIWGKKKEYPSESRIHDLAAHETLPLLAVVKSSYIYIWDTNKLPLYKMTISGREFSSIAWHPSSPFLFSGSKTGILCQWNPYMELGWFEYMSPLVFYSDESSKMNPICTLVCDKDSPSAVVSVHESGIVKLWNTASLNPYVKTVSLHYKPKSIHALGDNQYAIHGISSKNRQAILEIWDVEEGQCRKDFNTDDIESEITYNKQKETFFYASSNCGFKIVPLESVGQVLLKFQQQKNILNRLKSNS